MNTGFLDIIQIQLPYSCAMNAIDHLFKVGRKGVEGVALFSGVRDENVFKIQRSIIPDQIAGGIEDGLIYIVPGKELHRIALDLFDNKEQLVAQIHSHPNEAYHSETDDAFPIVTVLGGVSIVVPNFATGGINIKEWAIYRLDENRQWIELESEEIKNFIILVDDQDQ